MRREDYINKKLSKFYRRQITKRYLSLSREECDIQFGVGEFFHLNMHSKFSILNGVDNPEDLFCESSKHRMSGLAITETGYMSSVPDCYLAAKKYNLKYIVGMSAHFSDYETVRRKMIDNENDDPKNHPALLLACRPYRTPQITLLAKNEQGYRDLVNINAESWKNGYYYVPKVTREILERYANGNIIVMSGNLLDSFIGFGYVSGIENPEYGALSAYGYLDWFNDKFKDDFYIELVLRCQDSVFGSDLDRLMTQYTLINKYEKEHDIKLQTVVSNDVRHLDRKHHKLYKAMMAISRNTTLKRIRDYSSELYFKTRSELRGTYHTCYYNRAFSEQEFELACDKSMEVADKCENFNADTSPKLPEIDNADKILTARAYNSLKKKGLHKNKTKYIIDGKKVTYLEQTKIELDRFIEKGFASYFLIMQDLVKHSHDLGCQTGPSRGCSIPESIVDTVDGPKQIKNVTTDDLVYDATGEIQQVQYKLCYNINENIYEINFGSNKVLITSDHKLYIVRNKKVLLLKASEIKNTDEVIISQDLLNEKNKR